jgi:hypothetical protein
MNNRVSKQTGPPDLTELARKTGLVVGPFDSESVNRVFDQLEK